MKRVLEELEKDEFGKVDFADECEVLREDSKNGECPKGNAG